MTSSGTNTVSASPPFELEIRDENRAEKLPFRSLKAMRNYIRNRIQPATKLRAFVNGVETPIER
jgi:hypothetical protein